MAMGVLLLVPDGTLLKLVHAEGLTAASYRMGFTSVALLVLNLRLYGWGIATSVRNLGPWGFAASFLLGLSSVLFIMAVKITSVANVVMILTTSSFWAALLCRVVLGTKIQCRTQMCMLVVFFGVGVSVCRGLDAEAFNLGDALALCCAITGAVQRTIMRCHSDIDMLPAPMVGNIALCLCVLVSGQVQPIMQADLVPLGLLGCVFLPTSILLTTIGAQMLTSAESGLLLCLETVFSPVLAACAVGDSVSPKTWLGLCIVVGALVMHYCLPQKECFSHLPLLDTCGPLSSRRAFRRQRAAEGVSRT